MHNSNTNKILITVSESIFAMQLSMCTNIAQRSKKEKNHLIYRSCLILGKYDKY